MLFNRAHAETIEKSARAGEFHAARGEFARAFETRQAAADGAGAAGDGARRAARGTVLAANAELKDIRARAAALVRDVTGDRGYASMLGDAPTPDVNYVFPTFVTTQLPIGAGRADHRRDLRRRDVEHRRGAEFARDVHGHRHLPAADSAVRRRDAHYLRVSKLATAFWGVFACGVATFAAGPRVAHRGREPLRLVLLRLAARRLRPCARLPPRQRPRRFRRPASPASPSWRPLRFIPRPRASRSSGRTRSASLSS